MKKLIKFFNLFILVIVGLTLASCIHTNPVEPVVNAPVLHGVEDITIEKGSTFLPREGVTATDEEDGEINPSAITVDAKGFNPQVEGVYSIKYTVYDSDGNKTEYIRKVTVVYTDTVAPVLYGVSDVEVLIGSSFTVLQDVSAIDNVDGDLTSSIKIEGEVDVWVPGEYNVKYSVADKAGVEAVVNRKVTVSQGNFGFVEGVDVTLSAENNALTGTLSGGAIFDTIAPYGLIKVEATSAADETVTITIENTSSSEEALTLKAGAVAVKYFKFSTPLDGAKVKVEGANGEVALKAYFAIAADKEAPVVERKAEGPVVVPVNATAEFVAKEVLRGVTATDNLEGNVTSKLVCNLGDVDLAVPGSYKVFAEASDELGNVGKLEIDLIVAKVKDTNAILDPEFNETSNVQWKVAHNSGGNVVEEFKDGMFVITINTAGGWASGDSPYLSGINTDMLRAENYYMFKMDVKADVARAMQIRGGLELYSEPWIENFRDVTRYQIGTEWTTIQFIFYVSSAKSSAGSNNIKFEIHLGNIDWSAAESNNVVYIDNAQFYLLSNESNPPVISILDGAKTTYAVGDTLIDYKPYIKILDPEDGEIQVTDEMIDASKVDLTKAGEYELVITAADSDGVETVYKLMIKVLAEADTEGPVITIPDAVLSLIASSMPVKEGTDLTKIFTDLLGAISIVDNVDGTITPTMEMVDLGGLNVTSPRVGTYTVKISCTDKSGNKSNELSLPVVVVDGTAPVILGVRNYTVYKDQVINPLLGVEGYDSNDGAIVPTLACLTGFEQFLDATGKVVGNVGEYQVKYTITDKAGNKAEATAVITVAENPVTFDDSKAIDLLAMKVNASGGTTSISYADDGTGVLDYKGAYGWYASATQMKWYHVNLVANRTYKLVIESSAELPREAVIYFADSAGNKIPGFEGDGTLTKLKITLTTVSYVYEYIFTPTSEASADSIFEIDWDWESYLVNSQVAQKITLKQIKLVPEVYEDEPVIEPSNILLTVDFEDGAGSDKYVSDKWTQYKYTTTWEALSSNQMNSRSKNGSKVANVYSSGGMSFKYIFNENGTPLGIANHFEIWLGNYFSGFSYKVKVAVVGTNGTVKYVLGSSDAWHTFEVTTALDKYEINFEDMEVQSFYVVINASKDAYLYMDNIVLTGPAQSIEPTVENANVSLDFESLKAGGDYTGTDWTTYKYTSSWEKQTGVTMRVREKNGSKVLNMVCGYSMAYKYYYNEDGESLGLANHFSIKFGNYYDGADQIPYKITLVGVDGSLRYIAGSADNFAMMPVTTGFETIEASFEEMEVKCFYITLKSAKNGNAFMYMDDVVLNFVEETPAPQVTYANLNLDYEAYTTDIDYKETDWTCEKYTSKWETVTSVMMRIRGKNGTRVLNMYCGWSTDYRYTYNKDGESLGVANHFKIDLGNYFSNAAACKYKIAIVDVEGGIHFIAGGASEYATIDVTTGLSSFEFSFDQVEVKSFFIQLKSPVNDNTYIYTDNVILNYVA